MPVLSIFHPANDITPQSLQYRWLAAIAIVAGALIALFIAYQPVMFNFFTSDDFYIISWLDSAKHNTLLLFQGMYEGTPYYRPLLNLLLFAEYALCGLNSCLFRIIAIAYKILTAIVLYFVLAELYPSEKNQTMTTVQRRWSLFSAGLFLLYPLHTEPINWFVSTTEVLVNLFMLSSFLFYMRWRKQNKLYLAITSFSFAISAFLTKETAATLPAILLAYEWIMGNPFPKSTIKTAIRLPRIFINSIYTAPYWLLLAGYLVTRKIMTGNFLGNWNNTVFHFTDNTSMYKAWIQSLKMILMPLSSASFNHDNLIYFTWVLMLVGLIVQTVVCGRSNSSYIRLTVFLLSWFAISLLPMLKLLLITNDLLDARYGYIASVPLCAVLMLGLASANHKELTGIKRSLSFLFVLTVSCFVLRGNNLAWAQTGLFVNNLRSEFQRLHQEKPGDPKMYFFNIPVQYKGVAVGGIKTIQSMNHSPFSNRNFDNGVWLLNDDQSIPISSLKNTDTDIYYWSMRDQKLHAVDFKDQNLKIVCDLGSAKKITGKNSSLVFHPQNLDGGNADTIILKINTANITQPIDKYTLELSYVNDCRLDGDNSVNDRHFLCIQPHQSEQLVFIPLRGIPVWSLGGHCQSVKITLPKNSPLKIMGAYAAQIDTMMPKITLSGINYDRQAGQLTLNNRYPQAIILYDASSIKGCTGVKMELLGGAEYFQELNSPHSNETSLINLISAHPQGQITFNRNLVNDTGTYKVRLCPIDSEGKQVGFCSDHFILSVLK